MFKRSALCRISLLCALTVLPVPAFAVSQLSLVPNGSNSFVLQGKLDKVAGMQFNVSYDATTLSNPSLAMTGIGSGMSMNSLNAGTLLALSPALKEITGTGAIAILKFTRVSNSATTVTLSGMVVDSTSKKSQSLTVTGTLPEIDTTVTAGSDSGNNGSGSGNGNGSGSGSGSGTGRGNVWTGAGHGYPVGGTVTMPDGQPRSPATTTAENKDRPAQMTPQAPDSKVVAQVIPDRQPTSQEAASSSLNPKRDADAPKAAFQPVQSSQPIQSVLDKFRLFRGERTPKALIGLFDSEKDPSFSQSPAIAIADGKRSVKVTIYGVTGDKSPGFTFDSAKYVSLAQAGDGWEVEVIPEKGAVNASVNLLLNGAVQKFPLTVAPEIAFKKPGDITESDFATFLKEHRTTSNTKFDLGGEGRRDYLDDYIMTANYLVKMEELAKRRKVQGK